MYCFSFCELENALRNADKNYDETIVKMYFLKGLDRAKSMKECKDCKRVYLRVYSNLLNGMTDLLIPKKWRYECYLHLHAMMPLLSKILKFSEFKLKRNEVLTLHKYFFQTTATEAPISATTFSFSVNGIDKR